MTARHASRLVIVGGGLAGLGAAVEAGRAGLETCVVEQRTLLRGPRRVLAAFAASGAEAWLETAVWGIWGHDLALVGPRAKSSVVAFERLIIATGAFERPAAFPGWTLPGVMTLSGALHLLDQGFRPGQRLLVAGYGSVAATAVLELERRGMGPVAVLDATARSGRLPVRAEGTDRLQRVVTSRIDAEWRTRAGTEQSFDVDTLVLAFGSQPEDRAPLRQACWSRATPVASSDPKRPSSKAAWQVSPLRSIAAASAWTRPASAGTRSSAALRSSAAASPRPSRLVTASSPTRTRIL